MAAVGGPRRAWQAAVGPGATDASDRSAPGRPGRTFGGGRSWPAGGGGEADTATARAEEARWRGGAVWARMRLPRARLSVPF